MFPNAGAFVREPLSGFWQNLGYYTEIGGDWQVSREGRLTGVPYVGGIAPTPGMKGGSFFIKGIGNVNKLDFHRCIKRDILNAVGKLKAYSKVVGKNPDIIVEGGEII